MEIRLYSCTNSTRMESVISHFVLRLHLMNLSRNLKSRCAGFLGVFKRLTAIWRNRKATWKISVLISLPRFCHHFWEHCQSFKGNMSICQMYVFSSESWSMCMYWVCAFLFHVDIFCLWLVPAVEKKSREIITNLSQCSFEQIRNVIWDLIFQSQLGCECCNCLCGWSENYLESESVSCIKKLFFFFRLSQDVYTEKP